MKKFAVLSVLTILLACACNKPCPKAPEAKGDDKAKAGEVTKESLKELKDKLNYSVAYDVGKSLNRNKLDYDEAIFLKGLEDGMKDAENPEAGLLSEKERIDTKREHSMAMREEEKKEREAKGKDNKAQADKFLEENKGKEGVTTTESGLQYIVMTEGKGEKPAEEDRVSVHYKGTLIDGTEFDSSYKRDRPATFPVNRVVKGWTEALQLMPVGSKWKLFIPPELGYGERGAGSKIGPNSLLIFEVELLEIAKTDAAAPGAPPAMKKVEPAKIKAAPAKTEAAPQ